MKLSALKKYLMKSAEVSFVLWNGESVPAHYHVTEIGKVTKNFIDCGGMVREEQRISFQLRTADDIDHRLESEKLLGIISLFEKGMSAGDLEIEIEYQQDTIGRYALELFDKRLVLMPKMTDCLAKDKCGIPEKKEESCCGGGCYII